MLSAEREEKAYKTMIRLCDWLTELNASWMAFVCDSPFMSNATNPARQQTNAWNTEKKSFPIVFLKFLDFSLVALEFLEWFA